MKAARFGDEYGLLAPLYGVSPAELRRRDEEQAQPVRRWYVVEESRAVAAVQASLRPDNRTFLSCRVLEVEAYGPLITEAAEALDMPLYATCDESDSEHMSALRRSGFHIEVTNDRFVIPFDAALRRLARAWLPEGYRIRSVADVDEDRAFRLDNAVRSFVPGSEGWMGNRRWFSEELQSAEFDPDAYLVAVDEATDSCVGLLRIWRNEDGPRLGLIGVLPQHRVRSLAAALLRQGLSAASRWGFDTFSAETSPQNPHTYPALLRMGLEPIGRFHQLIRPS